MPPQQKPYKYWIIIFLLLLYLIPVSLFAFKNFSFKAGLSSFGGAPLNQLFENQSALINGKIKSISGNQINVENNNGVKGVVELSKNVIISDLQNPLATPSGDLKKIQTEKNAQIVLNIIDGRYQVVTINFLSTFGVPNLTGQLKPRPETQPAVTNTLPLPKISSPPLATPTIASSSAKPSR